MIPGGAIASAFAMGEGFVGSVVLRTATSAYLGDDGGLRLVVHGFDQPPGPACLLVEPTLLAQDHFLPASTPITIRDGMLSVGRGGPALGCSPLYLADQAEWSPPPPPPGTPRPQPRGHQRCADPDPDGFPAHRRALVERVSELVDHLGSAEGPPGAERAELGRLLDRVIGFGPGLTPSGDDALVGLLAVGWRLQGWAGPIVAPDALISGIEARLGQTTVFGRFFLAHGLAGRFGAAVLAAVDCLAWPATPAARGQALDQLLGLGATSGADTLVGITAALEQGWGPTCGGWR